MNLAQKISRIGRGARRRRARSAGARRPPAFPKRRPATSPTMQPPLAPPDGPDYQPVVTLNGWTLPWRMNGDWKEFHLVAEPVVREIAPGMKAHLWGYNGQSPGPTIEAVEGDKVRIFVTNKLPEHTTVHWHGMLLPNGMDGVGGLTQPHIKPGKTFVYEFVLQEERHLHVPPARRRDGADGDGHDGLLRRASARSEVHARSIATSSSCCRRYDIDPGSYVPKVMTMTDFNLWTWNSRVFPGIDPLVVRKGDRVRVRIGNLTMTNHPIHMHGYHFEVTCTDGGWVPESARWPEVTTDVPVGAMRAYRVRRRRAGRLGDPLPQVASHHERDGPRREDLHRRQQERDLAQSDPQAGARLHADGLAPAWPRWARWKCRCPTTRCR